MADELRPLIQALRTFAMERDWGQFHSPKNLACALSVEASELLEHFQWLTDAQSQALAPDKQQQVATEAADVFLYLLQLCDKLGIDLIAAAQQKMKLNALKYPVATARGSSAKYIGPPMSDSPQA
jgi:NTP pyrophosphatase (non-canonical NTP hydrolase)